MENLKFIENEIISKIEKVDNEKTLEEIRISELGKKGRISNILKKVGSLNFDERKEIGSSINTLKKIITEKIREKRDYLAKIELDAKLIKEKIDVTLPSQIKQLNNGRIHPVSQVLDEISEIFGSLGYKIAEGPDIEYEYYNFNALNIPDWHPARQMHDTFYLDEEDKQKGQSVLRTHTSPVQVRTMETGKPPFKFISPGRTYRCDSDQTHTPLFHQIEGLVVDEETNLGHLKWTLETFLSSFFEISNIKIKKNINMIKYLKNLINLQIIYYTNK